MHLFFFVRGVIQQLNIFEMFLQTHMWIWKREKLTKKGESFKPKKRYEVCQVQGALRRTPFGYEYIFPEPCMAEVFTMLKIRENYKRWDLGVKRFALRKLLGSSVKSIPEYKDLVTNRFVEMHGIAIYPIGIKKDEFEFKEEWGYSQEML